MLISFTVENFKSFKNKTTLFMTKSRERLLPQQLLSKEDNFQLVKGAAIYGANASGKSNFVDAIAYALDLLFQPRCELTLSKLSQFLLGDDIPGESSFEFQFLLDGKAYSYGFVVTPRMVVEEWLCKISSNPEIPDKYIFNRQDGKIEIGDYCKANEAAELAERTAFVTNTELFLSKSITLNTNVLKKYLDWFRSVLIIKPTARPINIIPSLNNENFRLALKKLLCDCGTGVTDIQITDDDIEKLHLSQEAIAQLMIDLDFQQAAIIAVNARMSAVIFKEDGKLKTQLLTFIHVDENGVAKKFTADQESDGTIRLVDLSIAFYAQNINVLIIDELDRSLHPYLTKYLFSNFINTNEKKQLIITTHETSLLNVDQIRRDIFWFVDKNLETGISSLTPLSSYKPRFDKELRKAYLDGRFYGVPQVQGMQ